MACINPGGTFSESAMMLLRHIGDPLTPEEISKKVGQPIFKVRSTLREMAAAELVNEEGGKYRITEKGKEKI